MASPVWPGRAGQHQVRQPQLAAHLRRVGGDGGGERMGGINDSVDRTFSQPAPHPLDAAEPADADLPDRQRRIGHPARQRADHVDVGAQHRGELARLRRTSEQQ